MSFEQGTNYGSGMRQADALSQTRWVSFLARAVAAVLLFEAASGLAITFGPFHPAVQWGLLLHTVLGLLPIAPVAWYFISHWNDYASQTISAVAGIRSTWCACPL